MSSGMTTASELSGNVSKTESSTTPRSSAMSVHSLVTGTPKRIKAWLTSSVGDSPVNPLAQQESDKGKMTSEICGRQLFAVYERSNPDGSSLKTSQDCSVQENQLKRIMRSPNQNLFDTLEPFSETWPRAGMMLDGVCYRQPKWERRISEIGCGLLPTPGRIDSNFCRSKAVTVAALLKNRKHQIHLSHLLIGSQIPRSEFPEIFEWIMKWPLGWTDLKPLETGKYRLWLRQHGDCLQNLPSNGGET